jgi:peroxiredoxin
MSRARAVIATLLAIVTVLPVHSQVGGISSDLRVGPQVGTRLPDLSVVDASGVRRTVSSLAGPRGLLLMFFRSVGWCAYCRLQLVDFQKNANSLAARGLAAAAITTDEPGALRAFAARHKMTIPLLWDQEATIAATLGLLMPQAPETAPRPPLPYEGVLWIDAGGVVRARYFEGSYHYRQTLASTLIRIGLGREVRGTRIDTPHLAATIYVSDAAAAPGTRVALIVDVKPAAGMFVYGVTDQRAPELRLDVDTQDLVVFHPLMLPPAERKSLPALGERSLVYRRPFRLMRQASIVASPEARALAASDGPLEIGGRFEYRACDSTRCYPPVSVPIRWMLKLKALD